MALIAVLPSNVTLKEFLEDITVISHNMSFNEFISDEDIDQQYNCHPYQVNWNISISRLTWKPLRTYLNISYVNLQSDLKGAIRDSDIDELENLKRQIEMQASHQEDQSEDLFDVNCYKNSINPLTKLSIPKNKFFV